MRRDPLRSQLVFPLAAVLLFWTYMTVSVAIQSGPNIDERAHLGAGLFFWETGRLDAYLVNPPTSRILCTAPIALFRQPIDADWVNIDDDYFAELGRRPEFALGGSYAEHVGNHRIQKDLFGGRLITIGLSIAIVIGIGVWTSKLVGIGAAVVAMLLWLCSPTVMNYSATIGPDIWGAAGGLIAAIGYARYRCHRNFGSAALLGLAVAAAILTKYTWVFLPLLLVVLEVAVWVRRRPDEESRSTWRFRLAEMFLAIIVCLVALHVMFGFRDGMDRIDSVAYCSRLGQTVEEWLGPFPSPIPVEIIRGIDLQRVDFENGKPSYLFGEHSDHGWWYWHLVALAVKEPIGWLLLVGSGIAALLVGGFRQSTSSSQTHHPDRWIVFLFAAYVVVLVCCQTGFTRYLRYLLPAYPFLCILGGLGADGLWRHRVGRLVVSACLFWAVAANVWIHPLPHAYFNELCGGPKYGRRVLLGPSIEWGEDHWRVQQWLEQHEALDYRLIGTYSPLDLPLRLLKPAQSEHDLRHPAAGTYVWSVNELYSESHRDSPFRSMRPSGRIGYSYLIYELPEQFEKGERDIQGPCPRSTATPNRL
ncbi:glycosyltransferase family 39 protein [Novipirellula artificiosorum]|uniref:Uncharacterized protein n=1 Tax=Novipirellula artificiosorum TaxID=2528016 RepID=A0A5C6DZE2_9BACT|nr:glycosyltransferase family 39 protein [Novipirellula artificiosorum]TWU40821.1 hypothetical protein Poly41_16560 [Novipirellula artificiosorum]